jgi:hypothetical protein
MSIENKFNQKPTTELSPEKERQIITIGKASQKEVDRLNKFFNNIDKKVTIHATKDDNLSGYTLTPVKIDKFYLSFGKLKFIAADDPVEREGWPCAEGTTIEIIESDEKS